MALPQTQNLTSATREDRTILLEHTDDMTGWTVQAELKSSSAAILSTKATGAGITISGTTATLDYTDGTSYALAAGTYYVYVRRMVAGVRRLLAVAKWVVRERGG